MACVLSFLQQYAISSKEFLKSTVTGDDTRVHHHTLVTKFVSMEWKHPGFQQLKSSRLRCLLGKWQPTTFWDHRGVLLAAIMQQGTTISAGAHCVIQELQWNENVLGCLQRVICSYMTKLGRRVPICLNNSCCTSSGKSWNIWCTARSGTKRLPSVSCSKRWSRQPKTSRG